MYEPDLTGISYSFTDDGHFEEAYYRAISNRTYPTAFLALHRSRKDPHKLTCSSPATQPQCPQGIMQFQHGTYSVAANGSLTLTPIAVDGRQLLSNPCSYENAIFTRYNQTEVFVVRSTPNALSFSPSKSSTTYPTAETNAPFPAAIRNPQGPLPQCATPQPLQI